VAVAGKVGKGLSDRVRGLIAAAPAMAQRSLVS
jgi:hypothetical protein